MASTKSAKRTEIRLNQRRIDRLEAKMATWHEDVRNRRLWTFQDQRDLSAAIARKWELKRELEIEHCEAM